MTSKQTLKNDVFTVYKDPGETPLECINRFKSEHPEYASVTMSYAGRLDPLAEGLLMILAGDEANGNRKAYLGLQKEYDVEVLFGASTDTHDVLGLITGTHSSDNQNIQGEVEDKIKDISNFHEMPYPMYSSRTVMGKPLFEWARSGRINEIQIPKQQGKMIKIDLITSRAMTKEDLSSSIINKINSVSGDFRQQDILDSWHDYFENCKKDRFLILRFHISCESGVYMRSFAQRLGDLVDVPALAFSIVRTRIGDHVMDGR